MEINNFKLLEKELMEKKDAQIIRVQNNLDHSRSLFKSIGDIVELYFPKFVEVLIKMAGSKDPKEGTSKYPHEN